MTTTGSDTQISVWDPLVRFGHWALVAAFAIAYISGDEGGEPSAWHEWTGYIAGGIVVWRVLWGLTGTRYARFSDFVVGPRAAIAYLGGLITGNSRRYVGHSPAGGAMILALLTLIAATVVTGIVADPDGAPKPQPSVTVTAQAGKAEAGRAARSHEEREGRREHESFIGEVHAVLANVTLFLVILHILGVVLASYVHRENLAAAMITGKKRGEDAQA